MLIVGGNQSAGGYEVDNSLRFDDGSGDELTRSQSGSPSSRRLFTFSAWVKRGNLNSGVSDPNMQFFSQHNDTTDRMDFRFQSGDTIDFFHSGSLGRLTTNRLFRDTNAWYHIVLRVDTTQATSSDRYRLYVNGVQETSFSTETQPSQNADLGTNFSTFDVGDGSFGTEHFDGYMCEVVYCDGQSLDPTSFGEFDADSGIWKPIDVSGLTFGTNGFYLQFQDSAALGDDTSGNGNDFTVNNLTSIDQSTDTCTNNFATMNPLAAQGGSSQSSSGITFSDGNLKVSDIDGTSQSTSIGTLGVDTGKWYWEVKVITDQDGLTIGGANQYFNLDAELGNDSPSSTSDAKIFAYYGGNGNKAITVGDGSQFSAYGAAIAVNDIIGVALNLDDNEVTFYKNGSSQGTFSITALGSGEVYFPAVGNWSAATIAVSFNFGSPAFTISSGNSDADGYGNFEYSVPSGYYALNTKNLAEYG